MKATNNTTERPEIMVIDDSQMIINFLKTYLGKAYHVIDYTSTSEALEDLAEGEVSPQFILTDFYLGNDLTGLEFIQSLKSFNSNIPVMVLSGSCDMNQKIKCLKSGAVDFVNKPFSPMELEARIKNELTVSSNLNYYRNAI